MFYARNNVPVKVGYSDSATFRLDLDHPMQKLTVRVQAADVVMQITEEVSYMFEYPDTTEAQLEKGFHSLTPAVPWTAVRFRLWTPANPIGATTANVILRAYGI